LMVIRRSSCGQTAGKFGFLESVHCFRKATTLVNDLKKFKDFVLVNLVR